MLFQRQELTGKSHNNITMANEHMKMFLSILVAKDAATNNVFFHLSNLQKF